MALKRRLKILDCDTEVKITKDNSLKVAFSSTSMKQVNQHFGSAKSFVIYTVDSEKSRILEVIQFGDLVQDGDEDKLISKMSALDGCIAVYAQAIGASAARQLKALGIQPVKVAPGADIPNLLASIREELSSEPRGWLARAIESKKAADPKRFDQMEADGWEE